MTLSEFKAWLDGFGEAIGEAPEPEQWARVREKLAQVQEPYALPALPTEPCVPTSPLTPLDSGFRCSGSANTDDVKSLMSWNAFFRDQEPLGGEFAAIWDANAHTLYEN